MSDCKGENCEPSRMFENLSELAMLSELSKAALKCFLHNSRRNSTDIPIDSEFQVCTDGEILHQDLKLNFNCTDCMAIVEAPVASYQRLAGSSAIQVIIPYLLLVGSIASAACLIVAISIFYYLKCSFTDRLKILLQMMIALLLKSITWIIIAAPATSPRILDFRQIEWACNIVICLHLYSLLVTTFWMLFLGHYLNEKLAQTRMCLKSLMEKSTVFIWLVPAFIISIWATFMKMREKFVCWTNYPDSRLFWMITMPIVISLVINSGYLFNIICTIVQRSKSFSTTSHLRKQFRNAKRDIVTLFPLLGINNLLFLCNPKGGQEDYYMLFHTICQSFQGSVVAIICCFTSADIYQALKKRLSRDFGANRSRSSRQIYRSRINYIRTTRRVSKGDIVKYTGAQHQPIFTVIQDASLMA